jgi:hypothetical protein
MRRFTLLSIAAVLALSACSGFILYQPLMVASGYASKEICSGTFISKLDPDQVYADMVKPEGAIGTISPLIHFNVDREKGEVTTTIAGLYKGLDCIILPVN